MSYQSVFAPGLLAGRTVVVTGGGSGIGRCTAHELAALGAHVVLVGRKADKLKAVQAEIAQDGGQASWQACDIRQEAAVQAMVRAIVLDRGGIDALVNNAGGQYMTPLENIGAKGWQAVIDTNLTGGFLVARECYLQSMQQHGGAIVNIVADIWGSMPGMGHSGRRARHGQLHRDGGRGMGRQRRARERGGARLHRLQRHGPLPARGWRHAARHAPDGAGGALRHRGRGVGGHRVPAQPGGQLHQRQRAARGWRAPQARMGWGMKLPDAQAQQRAAVRPFDGFHRAVTPRVFASQDAAKP
jgi:citronellol/citronellal dehydrogenase